MERVRNTVDRAVGDGNLTVEAALLAARRQAFYRYLYDTSWVAGVVDDAVKTARAEREAWREAGHATLDRDDDPLERGEGWS